MTFTGILRLFTVKNSENVLRMNSGTDRVKKDVMYTVQTTDCTLPCCRHVVNVAA